MNKKTAVRWTLLLAALVGGIGLSWWTLNHWFPAPLDKAIDAFRPTTYAFRTAWMSEEAVVVYPAEARRKNLEGSVVLAVTIDADGAVRSVEVEEPSSHEVLDKAALAAARHFKVDAAKLDADTFPYRKRLKLTFKLESAS